MTVSVYWLLFTGYYLLVMDSLNEILSYKDFDEPPEITAIKQYIERHFQTTVGVAVQQNLIIITAKSAALAGTLRMHTRPIQVAAATEKRLLFRIG